MQSTRKVFRVNRCDINYLRTIIESYDGMAIVKTIDPFEAYIEIRISSGCEDLVYELLDSLVKDEGFELMEKS